MTTATQLRLYNSRTRRVEPFAPLQDHHVRIYVCGLTPSAEAHLGHARSFLFFDVLRRYLVSLGLRVTFVQNVTDIDDRSIAAANQTGGDWRAIVEGYFQSFKRSMQRLHVREPDHEPRATTYIPQILEMIGKLIDRGHAYVAGDGVYFRVRSFPRYGQLSGRNVDELLIGARIEPGEQKTDPLDFALWKFAKPGEPRWDSPWGAGRPGWHIECSAMSHVLLGEPFDIHGGGFDLVFPHHENEIAQSESLLPAPPMANVWVHGGLLAFDGRKMSKSLGNFEPLYALLDRHDAQAIRLLFLQTGYRKPMNFTEESIAGASSGLRRLLAAYDAMRCATASEPADAAGAIAEYAERFRSALDDDMNTSGAVSVLFDLAAAAPALIAQGAGSGAAAFLHESMDVLGISPLERAKVQTTASLEESVTTKDGGIATLVVTGPADPAVAPTYVDELRARVANWVDIPLQTTVPSATAAVIAARVAAKNERDFSKADALRDALAALGVSLRDAPNQVTWSVDAGGKK